MRNRQVCSEHYHLTLHVHTLARATPGQFVHIGPNRQAPAIHNEPAERSNAAQEGGASFLGSPLLRRAFSIAGVKRAPEGVLVDVIYRVVGTATEWLRSLGARDAVSMLGPLGKGFPIREQKPCAWLIAGGVGLPPILWLAETLHAAGKEAVAFCGAQRADLLALTLDRNAPPDTDAVCATTTAAEFARNDVKVVISTDDGSLGFCGHVGAAMVAYHQRNPISSDDLVVYTCGPEDMMRFVAEYCIARGMECYVCMERTMACGTGTCQSCVVPVHDESDPEGWCYQLCCSDGPVFDAARILWDPPDSRGTC